VPSARLTLIGKPGCHLCDEARDAVTAVVAQLGADDSITLEERSILDEPELHARYWDEIPVVQINGAVHTIWRVDPERLRVALAAALAED
jgi:glutaredoxin